jgi:hypothetical protein
VDGSLNIAQGDSININVTLTSYSNQMELIIPLYLAIGAFQNQRLNSGYIVIATPSGPYSSQLPWSDVDQSTAYKPFAATFDPNPLIMQLNESKTAVLVIRATENTALGVYSIIVQGGNVSTTFQLRVTSKT